jgi:hypothetical protein
MNKQEIKDLFDDVQNLVRQWEQETQGIDVNKAHETYGKIPDALDKLNDIIRYDRNEIDEKMFNQICGLGGEITEGLKGAKQFLSRLEPLQRMVIKFADEAKKVANEIGCSQLTDNCSALLDFCYYLPSDFHCLPRDLPLCWINRVIQLRVDLLGVKDDIFLNLKSDRYDRYRENIEQLQAEYKAILDYIEQCDDSKQERERIKRIKDDRSGKAKQPAETGQKDTPAKIINIGNFKGILGDIQAENVQTGNHASIHKQTVIVEKKKGILRRIPYWIYILTGFLATLLGVFYYLDYFGWLDPIKAFISKILWPK